MYIYYENYPKAPYKYDNCDLPLKWFGPLSHLNVLIGPNNSGKSRFIRRLLSLHTSTSQITINNGDNVMEKAISIYSTTKDILEQNVQKCDLKKYRKSDFNGSNNVNLRLGSQQLQIDMNGDIDINSQLITGIKQEIEKIINSKAELEDNELCKDEYKNFFASFELPEPINKVLNASNEIKIVKLFISLSELCIELQSSFKHETYKKAIHYVTIPRTLQRFKATTNNEYIDGEFINRTLRSQYDLVEKESDIKVKLHSGATLYDDIKFIRNGGKVPRILFNDFEKFINKYFFGDSSDFDIVAKLTPNVEENFIDVYIDGRNHPIYELGDGVQAVIMVLFPLFTCEKGSLVFIEEPEMNLHPHFQKILIEKIYKLSKERELNVIMTTQSNHFLDLSTEIDEEVSIFTFEKRINKETCFLVKNVQNKDQNILRLIGVTNTSVFMANCSIWIEGVTDRRYIKKYLKAYKKSGEFTKDNRSDYKEGIHYTFLEYAGSNLSHYLFENDKEYIEKFKQDILAFSITNKIFLIADKDNSPQKQIKHNFMQSLNNKYFQYYVLPCIEIENLLSKKLLLQILGKFQVTMNNLKDVEFNEQDYKNIKLGKFLENKLGLNSGILTAGNDTLKSYYKDEFSKKVENDIEVSWKDLSNNAKKMIKEMYQFIDFQNRTV
jgi:predicted ATPase